MDVLLHAELEAEVARLRLELAKVRKAVAYLADCVGPHTLSAEDGRRLSELLTDSRGKTP